MRLQLDVLTAEAEALNAGFISRVRHGRPMVTLKLASTLDGRIATKSGESQWITGAAARRAAHVLRGRHDAVLAGVGTVLADDPALTCRIPGFKPVPMVRVVVDSHLRTKLTARLVATARDQPCWIVARDGADPDRRAALTGCGVELIDVPAGPAGVDIGAALAALARRGITRLLVEGGAQIAASLLRADLVDRIACGDGR
jgi:diaminohydroxyphosphoribosylaminopyrimidine deaminase/5-amino-6-(5-phosphoribosylamino)uracil reductase